MSFALASNVLVMINAKNMLDNKYGSGGWKSGPKSEYNKIVKWITRSLLSIYVPDNIKSSGTFYYDDFGNYMYSCYDPNYDCGYYDSHRIYVVDGTSFWRVFE